MTAKNIVVATDLSDTSAAALRSAVELAAALGASVTLLHVLEPPPTPPGLEAFALEGLPVDWEERLLRGRALAAQERVASLAKAASTDAVTVSARLVTGLLPDSLVSEIKANGYDLLIVGSHGRTGVAHFFLGSVAEKLVRHAPCPVLVVRPPGGHAR